MELCDFALDDYIRTMNSNESSFDIDLINSSTFALVSKNCSLPEKWLNTWTIGSHIARGLEFMHIRNHIHRDLKPGNSIDRFISFTITDMYSSSLLSSR
jgi:serine/threonine protein kinase